jgi:hypothetical protein
MCAQDPFDIQNGSIRHNNIEQNNTWSNIRYIEQILSYNVGGKKIILIFKTIYIEDKKLSRDSMGNKKFIFCPFS